VGIGFAIPANMVRTVVESARSGQALVRAWSGLAGQDLTAELAEGLRLDRPGGVVISDVYQDGPADRAGIAPGDVIVAVNDQAVTDLQSLRYRVATGVLGETLDVELRRKGETVIAALPLEAPPETPSRNEVRLLGHHPLGGAYIASLSPALSEELDMPDNWAGVVITRVQRGTPADRVGFRANDIILSLNGETYERSGDLSDALDLISDRWQIVFKREGKVRRVEFSS
jgi:serine protease Do